MSDAEYEKMEAQLIEARRRVVELECQLKQEHTAQIQLVKRLCDALGDWSGPWEEAAVARLVASRKRGTTTEG